MNPENIPYVPSPEVNAAIGNVERLAQEGVLADSGSPWNAKFSELAVALEKATGEPMMQREGEADPDSYRQALQERAKRLIGLQ
jgi:hypothetical protein